MRVLTLKLITEDAFALILIDIITLVKALNDAVCLTIIKYKGNRRNRFKSLEYQKDII